jgi:hypothetical protein
MPVKKRTLTGTVIRTRIAPTSKRDHVGVVMRTGDGKEYALRRSGGNAFQDDELDKLVGKTITGSGLVADHTFILDDWVVKKTG